jgi:hypothetical protein
VATGISPVDLLATDLDIFHEMVELLVKRGKDACQG